VRRSKFYFQDSLRKGCSGPQSGLHHSLVRAITIFRNVESAFREEFSSFSTVWLHLKWSVLCASLLKSFI
jgi:hypothetical protein